MKSDWNIKTLSEISKKTGYGYTASAKEIQSNNEPKFLRITDIQGGVVDWLGVPYCEIEDKKLNTYKLEYGDIVVARTGNSTGENYMYDSNEIAVFASYLIRYIIDQEKADPKFIWYQMRSRRWIGFINNVKGGSAQAGANAKTMGAFECVLPPLPTQKKIAHILSTIDDKIELNRKMNQTLEEMAQALFKSWFVDFDPVYAKADAKSDESLESAAAKLGISKEMLELFPSEFEESEMGMIPKGWEMKSIYDLANIIYGAPFSSKQFNATQTGKPLIRIRDLKTFNSQHWTEEEHVKGTLITAGDLLIGMDAEFTPTIWQGIDGWLNQRVLKVVPLNGTYTAFHYFSLKPKMRFFEQANVGTTVIHLGKKDIDTIRLLVPSQEILAQSASILEPLFKQLVHNSIHNRSLQKTRDTLLPKLLSGELDVSEIEIEGV